MGADAARTAEHERLDGTDRRAWMRWGPYLSERGWGTVREDYGGASSPWSSFTHDHARSRAYRWNEDGLAGISDIDQTLCLAFAFWNGVDPILKERIFGLTGDEGNHGEDAKETWWYTDASPTGSYLEWSYVYPQAEFPYSDLVERNGSRSRSEREYELEDTGAFDDGYWDITVRHAKISPDEIVATVSATNRGPKTATLHVLPTMWFRNTWSHDEDAAIPELSLRGGALHATSRRLPTMTLRGDGDPTPLFCNNETNTQRLWGYGNDDSYPKDGINDHVITGAPTVDPRQVGTKAALWYEHEVAPGDQTTITVYLTPDTADTEPLDAASTIEARRRDTDDFYNAVIPPEVDDEARGIARAALAGMIWGKQFYAYDVDPWIDDEGRGLEPERGGPERNHDWPHHFARDVISMPDPWEYPWYAAWDLAFHCVPLAHVDPAFAKEQLLLLTEDRYMHPNGQLPAYEWSFSDVNPPVHAHAALQVYEIDGSTDRDFLVRIFNRLVLNFAWWVNRKDLDEDNVFGGGFLGLDNIGPIDRSGGLPEGYHLDQADGTAWMASYALDMLKIALILGESDPVYDDMANKFFDHFAHIATAMHEKHLWHDESGFYYDILHGGSHDVTMQVRSMVGLLPLCAATPLPTQRILDPSLFADHVLGFVSKRRRYASNVLDARMETMGDSILLAVADLDRLRRVLRFVADPDEFLSPHGLRSLSAAHRDEPFSFSIDDVHAFVGYEPGESNSSMFGGNSNWRGPVWFPVNHMIIRALRRYHAYAGDAFTIEYPTGSGENRTLDHVADDLSDRLVSLFRSTSDGTKPFLGGERPPWADRLLFHEYFDGDTGRGLGASHQTGWTGLVADLIIRH